ncbi:DUF2637 domain-containing protein [Promicromonospora kroppenstedtii]|uniref:DUF2637 domain-containing protein n=1 Tax=Promicromonospora kroppenstedtii TaxID=440482 RepID=UPI0004B7CAFE|nr:DUF2637 domain-containing protein [Promicromonospora kroppenstedtii]
MSQHRPALINPDTRGALAVALLATAALVGISFTLSYAGLSALAPWAAVPLGLAPLIPVFIDGAIGVYTYSALAATARRESAARPWTWVALWTLVSSSANAAHAWSYGPGGWEGLVGATLAGLFPIGSLLGTHEIAARMIGRPEPEPAPSPLSVLEGIESADLHLVEPEQLERLRAKVADQRKPRGGRRRVTSPARAAARERARDLRAQGHTVRAIAAEVGLSHSTVAEDVRDVVPA